LEELTKNLSRFRSSFARTLGLASLVLSLSAGSLYSCGSENGNKAPTSASSVGCTKDSDCKGDRLCLNHQCAYPNQNDASNNENFSPSQYDAGNNENAVPCDSHASQRCYQSDVYWVNSCGNLEGIAQDCLENESCTDNSCVRRSCINNQETYVEGNLCWQKVPTNQQMTSRQAIQHCENLAYANFSDWRVPTIRELRTLVRGCPDIEIGGACPVYSGPDVDWNGDCTNGCPEASGPGDNGCYMTISVQGPCGGTWSSSQGGGGPFEVGVWALNYQRGIITYSLLNYQNPIVRCVRDD